MTVAGPTTEVLNEDLKDLRREFHERSDSLMGDFQELRVDFAGLHGELKVTLRILSWAGALLVTTILTMGSAGLWWASGLDKKVEQMEVRIDERFKAVDARLDRIDSAVNRLFDQGRAMPLAPKPEDASRK